MPYVLKGSAIFADGPLVLTVRVAVPGLLPGVTLDGANEQELNVKVDGNEQLRETLLANGPPCGLTVTE